MVNGLLNTNSMQVLEKALDGTSLRNGVISNNIANVDTPNFKRSEVNFEDELQKAIDGTGIQGIRTDPRHFEIGGSNVNNITVKTSVDESTSSRVDGNNVDIDNEMTGLAKNSLMYNALAQQMSSEFSRLRYAITEGRK